MNDIERKRRLARRKNSVQWKCPSYFCLSLLVLLSSQEKSKTMIMQNLVDGNKQGAL